MVRSRWFSLLTCVVIGAPVLLAAPAQVADASVLQTSASEAVDSLGMDLADPAVLDAMNLFKLDKVDDAISSLDRIVKERIQGDPERNRELRLLAGILAARGTHKLPDVYSRLRAAEGVNDAHATTAKAEAARDAVKWAVKNGVKGDRPDLKKDEDWLRALDGVREDYAKELRLRYAKLDSAVRERTFRGIEPLVTADRAILARVMVIRHLPEKGADIRAGYVDKLKQTIESTKSAMRTINREIEDLRDEKRKLPEQSGKRRQINDKIELKQKQISEAEGAIEVLNGALRSLPG